MQKSETILNEDIESEIRRAWHFMPYKIDYDGSSINRFSSEIDYECLACNAKIHTTFARLEEMWNSKHFYCPYCCSSYNPVYEQKLPGELVEHDPALIPDLDAEYAIMSGIEEHLKCKPYGFKNINKGRSVRLQHKPCSTIFTATPSMLYKQFTIQDRYTGEPFTTPYCPKCNQILEHEGINYGGTRFVERLHNWFADMGKEMPYEFNEDDLYRFKDYDLEIIATCVYCGHRFPTTPNALFTETGDSLCPVCDGKPRSEDSAEGAIQDLNIENAEKELEEQQIQQQQTETEPLDETATEEADTTIQNEPETFVDSIDKPISSDEVFEEEITQENDVVETSTEEENLNDIPDSVDEHTEFTETVEEPQSEETIQEESAETEVVEETTDESEDLLAKYGSSDDDYGCSIGDTVDSKEESQSENCVTESDTVEEPIDEKSETQKLQSLNDLTVEDVMNSETESMVVTETDTSTSEPVETETIVDDETDDEVQVPVGMDIIQPIQTDSGDIQMMTSEEIAETISEDGTIDMNPSDISEEPSQDEVTAVETDVDSLVDNISDPGLDLYEPENESQVEQPEIDQSDYPLDYAPVECPVETPDFANPPVVDTPENQELIGDDDPQPETYEEMTQGIGEIIQDLNESVAKTEEQEQLELETPEEEPDDDNLGIPDTEPEDDDIAADAELTNSLMTALGEETPTKPAGDLLSMGTPDFDQYQMRHPFDFGSMETVEKPVQTPIQTENQVDIINKTIPDQSTSSFVDDGLDIDWSSL